VGILAVFKCCLKEDGVGLKRARGRERSKNRRLKGEYQVRQGSPLSRKGK